MSSRSSMTTVFQRRIGSRRVSRRVAPRPVQSCRAVPSRTQPRRAGWGRSRGRSASPGSTRRCRHATSSTRESCSSGWTDSTSPPSAASTVARTRTWPGARSRPPRRRSTRSARWSATPCTTSARWEASALRRVVAPRIRAPHGLRRAQFSGGVFWKPSHLWLARAAAGLALPRRLWPLRAVLALKYARYLYARGKVEGGGPLLAPYFLLCDLAEMSAAVRNWIRYGTPML